VQLPLTFGSSYPFQRNILIYLATFNLIESLRIPLVACKGMRIPLLLVITLSVSYGTRVDNPANKSFRTNPQPTRIESVTTLEGSMLAKSSTASFSIAIDAHPKSPTPAPDTSVVPAQRELCELLWRRQSGVTDTNYNGNTGPSSAANGSFYIYSECDHLNDETVTYQLDLVSQLDVASVSFKYFLYGKEITGVQFLYSINGSGWTSLWQKTSQVQTS